MIKAALDAHTELPEMNLRVFAQGSYRANTNIRADSDVDICVCNRKTVFTKFPEGMSDTDFGYSSSNLSFSKYKNMISEALQNRFGFQGVTRGDKAFNVHANTYRIIADVVPTFEFREYYKKSDGTYGRREGVRFITDSGKAITNWPDQTYKNGTEKTESTGRLYKQVVRVLKGLRNTMQEEGIAEANNVASFLIESVIWNVSDEFFDGDSLYDVVSNIVTQAWHSTEVDDRCKEWAEVNDIKYLFRSSQPWKRAETNAFLLAVISHVGFA